MEGFLEHIVSNSPNFILFFQVTIDLLKNMDVYIATLIHKL